MTSRRLPGWLVAAALVAPLACADGTGRSVVASAEAAGRLGSASDSISARDGAPPQIRLINALPGADGASVGDTTASGTPLFAGVDYKSVTPYVPYLDDAALGRLQLRGAGRAPVTAAAIDERLSRGARYSLVASDGGPDSVHMQLVQDALDPAPGQARVRLVHALRGEGPVTVRLSGVDEPLLGSVAFGASVEHTDFDPTEATLTVRGDESGRELVRRKIKLLAGHVYTVVITGAPSRRIDAIVIDDQISSAR